MNGYVAAGWSVTVVVLVAYGWRTLRRGRILTRLVSKDGQPWR